MQELVRLSPLRDESELEKPIAALRKGKAIVMPDHCGMVVAQSANVKDAETNVRKLTGHMPFVTLPSIERFTRIFAKEESPLLDWVAPIMQADGLAMRLPHQGFPRGMPIRFAAKESVAQAVIEGAKVPVWTATFPDVKGKPVTAMALRARLAGHVDCIVENPFEKRAPSSLTFGLLLGSGAAVADDELEAPKPRSIHFVCLGNLNRSTFAHHRLVAQMQDDRKRAEDHGYSFWPAWEVSSSGVIAQNGRESPDGMVAAAKAWGLEEALKQHRSLAFYLEYGRMADWLIPMSSDVRDQLSAYGLREKMQSFGRIGEISDPMGGDLDDYVETANAVETMLLKKIISPACPL